MNDYIKSWEVDRPAEVKQLCDNGIVPLQQDMEQDKDFDIPYLMGQVAGVIEKVQPANCWPNVSRWSMKLDGRFEIPSRNWRPNVSTLSYTPTWMPTDWLAA